MMLDTTLCHHLSELVLACDLGGRVAYANPAAQRWSDDELAGQPFAHLLSEESAGKARRFLDAALSSTPERPCEPWELTLAGHAGYRVGQFRGYRDGEDLVVLGQVEAEEVGTLQRELLALTSELTEAQREQRRQNRELQQALVAQRTLIATINDLTAPAVPLWRGVLLLPIVGHLDSHRSQRIVDSLLQRVQAADIRYVILDVSGIAAIDTAIARQLIDAGQALRLLGATPVLVGINPEIAQTIVQLGVELHGLLMRADLQSALSFVIGAAGGRR